MNVAVNKISILEDQYAYFRISTFDIFALNLLTIGVSGPLTIAR